jgi:RHS repeat-associated protein
VRTLNIDEPLARIEADGTVRYYHADALGSVTALTDASESVQTRYKYESFGKTEMTLDDGHGAANPFRYTGRELDETGDYYYRARYYNPVLGRFISEDPIRFAGGEINWYVYAGNRPVNFLDPFGFYVWNAEATYISGGYAYGGGGYMRVTLTTYEGTNRITADYKISLLGVTVGLPAGVSTFAFIVDDKY